MAKRVHIKIADRGWILEKCASEIAARADYVSYGTDPDASADLQYYINYSARSQRVSPIEIAFFTHSEFDPDARRRYFNAAADVDHCVCMSARYAQELIDSGIPAEKISTIAPGVDLEEFRPKIRIGVVGRTYHTGRKGEALVAKVMDVPGIEWRFTGAGWPGPSIHVPDGGMPDFYNDLDYVLVPSLYEGGPMSVLEGLACGVPIISSDVGWVSEYPHIPFENGDADSLRQVLTGLVAERTARRAPVLERTWERWADEHLALFDRLLGGDLSAEAATAMNPKKISATLLTHGSESNTQGGPSVRVPRTASALRSLGVAATAVNFPAEQSLGGDLIHLFNIWPPRTSIEAARVISLAGKRLVFSPILLDLSEMDFWQRRLLEVIHEGADDTVLERLAFEYSERTTWSFSHNPEPGFTSRVRELSELSDALVFLSRREQSLFRDYAGEHDCERLIHNPVDASRFGHADPQIFRDHIGLDEFILCVGRIEPRKNQLFLVAAARQLGLPVVLIGHSPGSGAYLDAIGNYASDSVRLVGRLEPGSDLLRSAYAACRVFALPSWAEGAPLAALEAASSGANMVLSNRSGEHEYFGELARYADPSSIESLKAELLAAWNDPGGDERSRNLQEKVEKEYSWERYAEQTADLYRELVEREPRRSAAHKPGAASADRLPHRAIFVELSTTLNAKDVTGINRVEALVSRNLAERFSDRVRFLVWNDRTNTFMEVPRETVLGGTVRDFVLSGSGRALSPSAVEGGQLLVLGSGWFQNSQYAEAMGTLAGSYKLYLNVLVHDIIPALRPHWFPEEYAPVFVENLRKILRRADRVLTYSENTATDVRRFAAENGITCPTLFRIRLAGEIDARSADAETDRQHFEDFPFAKLNFVLAVGAIHKRKNYELLYDCWVDLKDRLGSSCPHLVIVGGVGWDGAETARSFNEDPRLAGLIHILTGVDDEGLAWLYQHCLFTVYPSLYEGWGLPVAESLAAGKIVIASNVSSVPEIAPDLCELIDPKDRAAWIAKIIHFTLSPASRTEREQQIRDDFSPVSWAETVDGIVEAVEHPVTPRSRRFLYSLGELASLSRLGGQKHKIYGWHLSENSGSWAASRHAGLRFLLRPRPTKDLVVAVTIRIFGKAGSVRVSANGEQIAVWQVPAGQDVPRFATIPKELVRADGELELDFESPRVVAVRAFNPTSGDGRSLGLGLVTVQVVEEGSDEIWNAVPALMTFPTGQAVIPSAGGFIHAQGFHPPEPSGQWSKFKESELTFRLDESGPIVLRFEVWAPLAESARARIRVRAGDFSREVRLRGGGNEIVWISIGSPPAGLCSATFEVDSMFVPSLHRGSEDSRELGILVKSVAVLNATEDEVATGVSSPGARNSRFPAWLRRRARRLSRALRI